MENKNDNPQHTPHDDDFRRTAGNKPVKGTDDQELNDTGDTNLDEDAITMNRDTVDPSLVRSGGITDMDDQVRGAGQDAGTRAGSGSNLTSKKAVTGSDYDGQNTTS